MDFFLFRFDVTFSNGETRILTANVPAENLVRARQELRRNIQEQLDVGEISIPEGATVVGFVEMEMVRPPSLPPRTR